jgi:nucleotide-binding universal stress UspA family protein
VPEPQKLWHQASKANASRAGLRRILCISDLQGSADLALDRASALARQFAASLHILYATRDAGAGPVLHLIRRRDRVGPAMRMEMFTEGPTPDSVEMRAISSPLYDAIANVSRQFGIDLIVTTDAGESWPNMERIIRSAAAPVLIVRREASGPYQRIAVASDLSESSVKLGRTMAAYGCLDAASVTFIHGFGLPYRGLRDFPRTPPAHLDYYRDGWRHFALKQLRADAAKAGLDSSHVSFDADLATPIDFIEKHISNARSDLLVAGTSRFIRLKRILGKSVTHQILDRILCDILLVA